MSPHQREAKTVRFDSYEADLRSGELRKSGFRVKLQDLPFQVLIALLDQPGQLVTRDELQRRLWPDADFGDFDHALNVAIAKLRVALSDSADEPRYIETLARRGYRFIGEVAPNPAPALDLTPASAQPATSRASWRTVVAISLAVVLSSAAIVLSFRRPPSEAAAPSAFAALPFTALDGNAIAPSFSPDGSRIAFAWSGPSADSGYDLYVKAIGGEALLRLTNHPSKWISSAWSPDGTQIAFHRLDGDTTGIYVVPVLGGPERKLHSTHTPYELAAPISWSPDGKWISFSDQIPGIPEDRIFLLSLDSLEAHQIPHNSKCLHEGSPVFSHRGNSLVYVCVHSLSSFDLVTVSPLDGAPRSVAALTAPPLGISWAADDNRLIVSQPTVGIANLYEVKLEDGSLRKLNVDMTATWPTASPSGGGLAYATQSGNDSLWRRDLKHPQAPGVEVIPSAQAHEDAHYSPDGQHIAIVSSRGGTWDVWMGDADGSNLVKLSNSVDNATTPRWSPDGKTIAFDSHRAGLDEIYLVDVAERLPRKLETNVQSISMPSWSRDGKWIYFRAYETAGEKIYRCPAAGGNAVALGGQPDGTFPQESFDGNFVFFTVRGTEALLHKISLDGNFTETAVDGMPAIHDASQWTAVRDGIYFVPTDSPQSLQFFDFQTRKATELFRIDKNFAGGINVSPDGRWLLYSQIDAENSTIMLVNHFN